MPKQYAAPPAMKVDPAKTYTATLETNKGTITAELYPQDAPMTVNNFVCLAEDGYYDNTPFHRIVSGFVIQGGDPTGTGAVGPATSSTTSRFRRTMKRAFWPWRMPGRTRTEVSSSSCWMICAAGCRRTTRSSAVSHRARTS